MKVLAWIVLIICALVFLFLSFLSSEYNFTEALVQFIILSVTLFSVGAFLALMGWSIYVIGSY